MFGSLQILTLITPFPRTLREHLVKNKEKKELSHLDGPSDGLTHTWQSTTIQSTIHTNEWDDGDGEEDVDNPFLNSIKGVTRIARSTAESVVRAATSDNVPWCSDARRASGYPHTGLSASAEDYEESWVISAPFGSLKVSNRVAPTLRKGAAKDRPSTGHLARFLTYLHHAMQRCFVHLPETESSEAQEQQPELLSPVEFKMLSRLCQKTVRLLLVAVYAQVTR